MSVHLILTVVIVLALWLPTAFLVRTCLASVRQAHGSIEVMTNSVALVIAVGFSVLMAAYLVSIFTTLALGTFRPDSTFLFAALMSWITFWGAILIRWFSRKQHRRRRSLARRGKAASQP